MSTTTCVSPLFIEIFFETRTCATWQNRALIVGMLKPTSPPCPGSGLEDHRAMAMALEPYGVALSSAMAVAIRKYIDLLLVWNEKISLTAITSEIDILRYHFGESLFALGAIPINSGRLADLGTGAGFPGLALKIASPSMELTLIESNRKKCAFLGEIVRA